MKKTFLLLAAIAISGFSSAQVEITTTKKKKLKLNSVGFEFGMLVDNYNKMDLESMYDLTKNPALLDRDLSGHQGSFYRSSSGSRVGVNLSFTPFSSLTDSHRTNHEVRFGAFYSTREPLISYSKTEADGSYSSIIYCNVVNEVSVNGTYIIRKNPAGAKWLGFYAGLGASLGSSFNDRMVVMEYENNGGDFFDATNRDESYEGKSSFFTRIYAPLGVDITLFDHFRFGLEGNVSAGMQNAYGGKTYLMPFGGGLTSKLTWVF